MLRGSLKQRSGSTRLTLVGYSGGGTIAVLLAARRSDVAEVITVAANLDVGYWTQRDGLSPLTGSLDPAGGNPRLHPFVLLAKDWGSLLAQYD
jgi:pimeloyl-ACP methyl ester carboxylesterase